ncbi:MAG: YdeI/OmpD-associated family protein [Actinomycetota bacterium]
MASTTFRTTILGLGNNTGIVVPPAALDELGAGRRPAVRVTVNGYTYVSTPAVMGGQILVSLSKAHRTAAGLAADDEVEVTLDLLTEPRVVEVPEPLASALARAGLGDAFAALAPSRRKEACRQVDEAKGADTRERRIHKILDSLA